MADSALSPSPPTRRYQRLTGPARDERIALIRRFRASGFSGREIAKMLDTPERTIYAHLAQIEPKGPELQRFQRYRADILDGIAAKALDLQTAVLTRLVNTMKNADNSGLSAWQQIELLQKTAIVADNLYKQQRLERGESTENVSQITHLLAAVHERRKATPVYPARVQSTPVSDSSTNTTND